MRRRADLTGKTFGQLTVIGFSHVADGRGYWRVRCSCGVARTMADVNKNKSCGCLRRRMLRDGLVRKTHGMNGTPTWLSWSQLRFRCINKKCKAYKHYGGRGITVCDRWMHSFENFLADMGEMPEGHSIERIDVNGNYEPSNCKWIPRKEQMRNTRKTVWVTALGRQQTASEWARHVGLTVSNFLLRLENGWTPDDAVTVPPRTRSFMGRILPRKGVA